MLNHLNVIYLFIHYNSLILNYIFFNIYWAFFIYFINFRPQYAAIADYFIEYYDVSVKSIISFVFAQISDLHLFTRRTLKTE